MNAPARPKLVSAICILWAIEGCLCFFPFAFFVPGFVMDPAPWILPAAAIFGLMTFLFLRISIQTYRGNAQDTLWYGIGSLIFGIYLVRGLLGWKAAPGQPHLWYLIGGGTCFAAGVLALIGRREYKVWREARNAYQAATSDGTIPPK